MLKLLAIVQILGGAYALLVAGLVLVRGAGSSNAASAVFLFASFAALSLAAGVGLLSNWKRAIEMSILVQAAQVPFIMTDAIQYSVYLLARFVLGWQAGNPLLQLSAGGEVFFGHTSGDSGVAINILALVFFLFLLRQERRALKAVTTPVPASDSAV